MNLHYSGSLKDEKNNQVECRLAVITFEEGGIHFYYAPALDLTGYGNSDKEARDSFDTTLEQFFNYGLHKKTLFVELKKLGWKVSKKSVSKPPSLVDMINKNEYLANIFEEKQYKKFDQNISLPTFA
jgi:hypothetical protein